MAKATLYSSPSTYRVVAGTGVYYGMLADRDSGATGGTVVLADALDVGAVPDIHNLTGAFASVGFPSTSAPTPVTTTSRGVPVTAGLTLSYTSTSNVTIFYDD